MVQERRTRLISALIVVGAIMSTCGVIVAFVDHALANTNNFADRATAVYSHPAIRGALTDAVVEQLLDAEPELVAVQPVLETVIDGVFQSELVTDIYSAAIGDLHRTVFTESNDTVTIRLAELLAVAKVQLTALDPELGALIPDELTGAIIEVDAAPWLVDVAQMIGDLGILALLFPLLALVAYVGALLLTRDPVRTTSSIGLSLIAAGAIVVIIDLVARALVVGSASSSDDRQLVRELWSVLVGDVVIWALVLAAVGAFAMALVWFGVGRVDLRGLLARLTAPPTRNDTRRRRAVWGVATCVTGLALLLDWASTVRFAAAVTGAVLVAIGALELIAAVFPRLTRDQLRDRDAPSEATQRVVRRSAVIASSVVGAIAIAAMFSTTSAASNTQDESLACNGSVQLCDRALDQVVFAATHNSQAASSEGFLLGNQRDGLAAQLDAGIRGFLIDVYFGLDVDGNVFTDRAPVTADQRQQLVTDHGEAAVEAAEAAAVRTGEIDGERGLYLCHAFCEIGATPFVEELVRVREFLEENPGEVIMLIIQDEGPMPADVVSALEASGLDKLVYPGRLDAEMPTLQEMIDSGGRVVVSAENRSGDVEWYHDAFELLQDTPFSYDSLEAFDCQRNRGRDDSPLLLVNHWLSPVSPTSAESANGPDVLRNRVDRCVAERGRIPNVIAVDFAELGNVVEIVEELNQNRRDDAGSGR